MFSDTLLSWFDEFGRKNLPWQKDISPYRVWISEIMLQQTQVSTVIPYFERFITHFSNVKRLARAKLDSVLHLWTGLGYYARARNIHKTAKIILDDFKQQFPDNLETLMSLPGIGRSTAGAILSIAFQKPTPILDGNVKRVLSRFYAIAGHASDKNVENKLWTLASECTPIVRCADYTQAIMDLGATLCTRSQPNCTACPLQSTCVAHLENRVTEFPQPKRKAKIPIRNTRFLIISNEKGEILLEKRPPFGIWGGLWGFPEHLNEVDIDKHCRSAFNCEVISLRMGNVFRHTFSHFHLDITPVFIKARAMSMEMRDHDAIWCRATEVPRIGLAAPVKKLLADSILDI